MAIVNKDMKEHRISWSPLVILLALLLFGSGGLLFIWNVEHAGTAFGALSHIVVQERQKETLGAHSGQPVDREERTQRDRPEEIAKVPESKGNGNGEDLSGFRGKHLFHVTTFGTAIEGVLFTKGSSVFPFHKDPRWEYHAQSAGKLRRFKGGQCFWCEKGYYEQATNRASCLNGTLYAGWYKDDHSSQYWMNNLRDALQMIEGRRSRSFTVYMRCMMDQAIPTGKEGVLRADNLDLLALMVNPRPLKEGTIKGKSLICVKSFYGSKLGDHALQLFLRTYLEEWKLDAVVFVEQSMTRGFLLEDHFESVDALRAYKSKGQVFILDHRDALQRMYGAVYQSMTFFSATTGQMLDISDCLIRAKLEGFEWALVADVDEILSVGQNHKDPTKISSQTHPFLWFISRQEKLFEETLHNGLPLVQIRLASGNPDPEILAPVCQDCRTAWGPFKYPTASGTNTSFSSPPKYVVRLNGSSVYPLIPTCGIHTLAASGGFASGRVDERTYIVDVNDAHIRHYKCLNLPSPCDSIKREFPLQDNWAFIVD